VPVVAIDLETDPVRSGLAAGFGRPGRNVTGLFMDQPSLAGKWIDLLREAPPALARLALLWAPTTTRDQLDPAADAARVGAPGAAAGAVRARQQAPDGDGADAHAAADHPLARRRGDRMSQRCFLPPVGGSAAIFSLSVRARHQRVNTILDPGLPQQLTVILGV